MINLEAVRFRCKNLHIMGYVGVCNGLNKGWLFKSFNSSKNVTSPRSLPLNLFGLNVFFSKQNLSKSRKFIPNRLKDIDNSTRAEFELKIYKPKIQPVGWE